MLKAFGASLRHEETIPYYRITGLTGRITGTEQVAELTEQRVLLEDAMTPIRRHCTGQSRIFRERKRHNTRQNFTENNDGSIQLCLLMSLERIGLQ